MHVGLNLTWRAGHRLYSGTDVRRLHRVVALRGFGLSLAEIGQILDGELDDARDLIRRQLEQVDDQLATANRLRKTLVGVLDGLDQATEPSTEKLIELIEGMTA
jgi:DNA-binding transcriptional MerR regulator